MKSNKDGETERGKPYKLLIENPNETSQEFSVATIASSVLRHPKKMGIKMWINRKKLSSLHV